MARLNERNYATRAQIKRIVDAAKDAGIEVGGIEVTPDGTIRVLSEALVKPKPESAYDRWKREDGMRAVK